MKKSSGPRLVDSLLQNARLDTDLLLKNDARGDDFSKVRTVDFLLTTPEAAKAQLVSDFMIDNQYGNASVEEVDSRYRIVVQVDMPTTQNVLCSVSGLMVCIAALFGVKYDGWGCSSEWLKFVDSHQYETLWPSLPLSDFTSTFNRCRCSR